MPKQSLAPLSPNNVLDVLPPFPIVLVTTQFNVITINQVEYFSFRPLRIGIAIAHIRHTWSLLKAEGEFVINVPDASLVEAVKVCGSLSGREHDKFQAAGLEREASAQVGATSIRQCGAQIECRVEREIEFENRTWFIGRVVAARVHADHVGTSALMCSRHAYIVPGTKVAPR